MKTLLTIVTVANLLVAATTGATLNLALAAACTLALTLICVLEGQQRVEEAVAQGLGVRVLAHDRAGVLTVRGPGIGVVLSPVFRVSEVLRVFQALMRRGGDPDDAV